MRRRSTAPRPPGGRAGPESPVRRASPRRSIRWRTRDRSCDAAPLRGECRGVEGFFEQAAKNLAGVEILFRDRARGPAMQCVATLDLFNARDRFLRRVERDDALPGGQPAREAGVLHYDGPSAGQVAGAAFAEPTALRNCVAVLGDAEFSLRSLDVFSISPRPVRDRSWIGEAPPAGAQLPRHIRGNGRNRHLQRRLGLAGQVRVRGERIALGSVAAALVLLRRIAAPRTNLREPAVARTGHNRPIVEHDRLACRLPVNALVWGRAI